MTRPTTITPKNEITTIAIIFKVLFFFDFPPLFGRSDDEDEDWEPVGSKVEGVVGFNSVGGKSDIEIDKEAEDEEGMEVEEEEEEEVVVDDDDDDDDIEGSSVGGVVGTIEVSLDCVSFLIGNEQNDWFWYEPSVNITWLSGSPMLDLQSGSNEPL